MTVDTTRMLPEDLATLVGSRLCHDLVSPLGAIGNGIELLEMSPDFPGLATSPEMSLIAQSVRAARERIHAFRIAFGQARSDQRVADRELRDLLHGASAQGRLQVELDAQGDFPRSEVRMLMLAVMCLDSAMPWGGRLSAQHDSAGWKLRAKAERVKQDDALWAWLDEAEECEGRRIAPSEVQFPLLARAVRDAGRRLTWHLDETGGDISF